jgi:4-hydroxybenzoate polyprenyltransferase
MTTASSPLPPHPGPDPARTVVPAEVARQDRPSTREAITARGRFASELRLTWALLSIDNVSITIVPGVLFTVSAWHAAGLPARILPQVLVGAVAYFFLYGYTFCLSNQLAGLEEDRVNKPHRPLVRGLATRSGIRWRLAVSAIAFAVTGWVLGVGVWALLWIAVTFLHNQMRLSRLWVAKNTAMILGMVAMLAAAAGQVAGVTAATWKWILVIAAVNAILVSLQDLRDVAGDAAVGRRTLPLVFGDRPTRLLLGAGFAALPLLLHILLFTAAGTSPASVGLQALIGGLSLLIACRVITRRSPAADHLTYLLYCWQYCVLLTALFFVHPSITHAGAPL